MQEQSYFQLLSPMIFGFFAIGFFLVFTYAKRLKSARWFAVSYICGAIAFLCDFFDFGFRLSLAAMFYMATAICFGVALSKLFNRNPPVLPMLIFAAIGLIGDMYFLHITDQIVVRILFLNFSAACIFGLPIIYVWGAAKDRLEKTILVLVGMTALQFVLRTILVLNVEADQLTNENYGDSLASITLQFSSALAALFLAMSLFAFYARDITLNLHNNSLTDPLTGLRNRRGFNEEVTRFEKAFENGIGTHALLMLDIDHFKAVNDTYGHDAGDNVLLSVGDMLLKLEDTQSIPARLGGEEFCILLYNTNREAAQLVAEYARSRLSQIEHDVLNGEAVTTSAGVVLWHRDMRISDALRHADQALYRAKKEGRNRVCFADSAETDRSADSHNAAKKHAPTRRTLFRP